MTVLNEGPGTAPTALYLDIVMPSAAAAMGGAILFFRSLMAAVHHANRHGQRDDFLAVAFPDFAPNKPGLRRFGERLRVFGSETRLGDMLEAERITQCLRTGLLARIPRIRETDGFTRAAAFVRVRSGDRRTVGDMMRRLERSKARGRESTMITARLTQLADETTATAAQTELVRARRRSEDGCARLLMDSGASLVIRHEDMDGENPTIASVSTYGLSTPSRPSPLPAE